MVTIIPSGKPAGDGAKYSVKQKLDALTGGFHGFFEKTVETCHKTAFSWDLYNRRGVFRFIRKKIPISEDMQNAEFAIKLLLAKVNTDLEE